MFKKQRMMWFRHVSRLPDFIHVKKKNYIKMLLKNKQKTLHMIRIYVILLLTAKRLAHDQDK